MNFSETAVTNAANLSLFMVDLTYPLLSDFRQTDPQANPLDLKAHFRDYKYLDGTIKLLSQKPEPYLLARIFSQVACSGRIHTAQQAPAPS